MLHHTRTFEEKRKRSRSADPSKRSYRKTDIFNTADGTCTNVDAPFSSEYKKSFAWTVNHSNPLDEETMTKRLNPVEKTHAAGLSSRHSAAINKAHVIENSNGSRSIVIGAEPADFTDFAFTTGSATNLAEIVNTIPQDAVRPLTSMALSNSNDLNKSFSSSGSNHSKVNKSVTITNLNDYTSQEVNNNKPSSRAQKNKDKNNSSTLQQNNRLDEKVLLEKLSKLNTYESIYGKTPGATTLFHKEEIINPEQFNKIPKKSEYKSKFKPFSAYVYVTGKGWFKPKKIKAKEDTIVCKQIEGIETPVSVKQLDACSVKSQETVMTSTVNKPEIVETTNVDDKIEIASIKTADEVDAPIEEQGQPWYSEAAERKLKANEFRYRSEYGNPILGRSSLEEVYKKASGNSWQASKEPKFEQLQQMRSSISAFLPYDQHKKKLEEDRTDSKLKAKATPSKSPRTKRATSVPPRKKSTSTTVTITPKSNNNTVSKTATQSSTQPTKVWIKPKAKENTTNGQVANKETSANKVQRSQPNNLNKELKQATRIERPAQVNGRASPPIIQSGPVRTTQIKSPEELSGIKSPPAANFLEQLDSEPINWTNSSTNPSLHSSNATYTNLMNEFNPSSIRSEKHSNLADLSGLKI